MVGGELSLPRAEARHPGAVLMRLDGVSTPDRGAAPGLKVVTLELRAGQITGLAGVSGNGQTALAEIVGGLSLPASGRIVLRDAEVQSWSPGAALAQGVARIPEDRHHQGSIADFDLTENAVLEGYRMRFSRRGWMNWRAAREFAEAIIKGYDVRCPGPETRIRLLSGGNMQKLILGRALASDPEIVLANQPVRGLDVGAIAYVQSQLIAARDRGAAVLLISEDLDEIMGLSDILHVISEGRLSPGFARGTMTATDLGLWMAGQKVEGAHAA
jgi:simple sugar transport system ATP-binding protein